MPPTRRHAARFRRQHATTVAPPRRTAVAFVSHPGPAIACADRASLAHSAPLPPPVPAIPVDRSSHRAVSLTLDPPTRQSGGGASRGTRPIQLGATRSASGAFPNDVAQVFRAAAVLTVRTHAFMPRFADILSPFYESVVYIPPS